MIVTVISTIACLVLYTFARYLLIPWFHRTFLATGTKKNKHDQQDQQQQSLPYEKQFSSFEQKVNAQKLVSFVHGVVSTYGAFVCILPYTVGIESYANTLAYEHEKPYFAESILLRDFYLEITLGYFTADLLMYLTDISNYSKMDIVHHVLSCIAYSMGLLSDRRSGSFVMICFQTNEISTPFYHIRYFLGLSPPLKKTVFYLLNEAIFSILFLVFRVLYNAIVLASVVRGTFLEHSHDLVHIYVLIVIMFMYYMVQLIWFYRIVQIVAWKLSAGRNAESKKSGKNAIDEDIKVKKHL